MGTPMPASPDVHRSASAASMSVLDLSGKLQAEACYAMLCAVCQSVERCDADAAARDALATQGTPYDSESASDMEPAFDNRGKAMPTLKALKSQYKSLKVVCRVRTSAVRPIQSELESRAPTLLGEAVSFKDASFSTFRSQFGISAPLVCSLAPDAGFCLCVRGV